MKIEIWSDVVCPWCYVGKRNLEAALAAFPHADRVTIEWRSFELDPTTPVRVELSMDEVLERKYGMSPDQAVAANRQMTELAATVGLEYHLDRVQIGNTFDAHRLIHLADAEGRGGAMKERLLAAYFTEGRSVSDHATLAELAQDVGLDPALVAEVLDGDGPPSGRDDCAGRRPPEWRRFRAGRCRGLPPSRPSSSRCPLSCNARQNGSSRLRLRGIAQG